jgi:hypothetical protein
MPKAIWNGAVLAESDKCEVVEGNQYFPPDAINKQYFKESNTHTTVPGKVLPVTTPSKLMGNRTRMLPGITQLPRRRRKTLKDMLPSGKG